MYTVTLNELKVFWKVSTEAGQSDVVKKMSEESTDQDEGCQELRRLKKYIL
jgi:hypothetical protein